jgi:hypothetical protein
MKSHGVSEYGMIRDKPVVGGFLKQMDGLSDQ